MIWKESKLGTVCRIIGGKPAPKEPDAFDEVGIPFVRMKDLGRYHLTTNLIHTDDKISFNYAKKNKLIPVPKGAILLPRSGSVALNHRAVLGQDSMIVSHICALHVIDDIEINNNFLYYLLCRYDMSQIAKKTTGLDAINFSDLGNIKIKYPDLETQNKIVAVLDKANNLVAKRDETIKKYNELLRAVFLEMFGDPVQNERKWSIQPLKSFGNIITGNTPPRSNKTYYNDRHIEWIKTNNIIKGETCLTTAEEYLSERGWKVSRWVESNSLLVACIAGSIDSIARAGITDKRVAFNQQINAIVPNKDVSVYFLYWLTIISYKYIQSFATKGMKRLLTKGVFEKIEFIKPEYTLQLGFETIAIKSEVLKRRITNSRAEIELLIKTLSQLAFKGKLSFNTAIDLEALLNAIDLGKSDSENDIDAAINNKALTRLLVDRLNKREFENMKQYEKGKYVAFRVLKEAEATIDQSYSQEEKQVQLSVE